MTTAERAGLTLAVGPGAVMLIRYPWSDIDPADVIPAHHPAEPREFRLTLTARF